MEEKIENLYQMLRKRAISDPRQTALFYRGERIPYRQLLTQVERISYSFREKGIKRGDCVALVLRNSPEFIMAYIALSRIGAVAVPINFLITKPQELEFILGDCKAAAIITQAEFFQNLAQAGKNLPHVKHLWSTDSVPAPAPSQSSGTFEAPEVRDEARLRGGERFSELCEGAASGKEAPLPAEPGAGDIATILYTSGTMGRPKGVMLTHGNLISNCRDSMKALEVRKKDVMLCILPMFHTFAWTVCALIPIYVGAASVVVSSITPPTPWLKLMGKLGVTVFAAVPQIYSVLAKAKGIKRLALKYLFFRKVRLAISGAAPLSERVLKPFEKKLGVEILEGYGLTETSPVVSCNSQEGRKIGSVGRCIPNVEVRVIDDSENVLETGREGEICVRGPNVMKGYHNLPGETREAFTRDGWFKTGDIGMFDGDGFIYIRDRKKDMIIVKGEKVYPAQVESVIMRHPAVEEAAVVGIPQTDADEKIKCFLTLKKDRHAEKSELIAFCRERLDPFTRPRDIEIVDALPKNALQKVLKRVLRQKEMQK